MMSDRSPINVMQPEWEADCYFRPGVTPQGSQGAPDLGSGSRPPLCSSCLTHHASVTSVTSTRHSEVSAVASAPALKCPRPYHTRTVHNGCLAVPIEAKTTSLISLVQWPV